MNLEKNFKIEHRKLSRQEIIIFMSEIENTVNITGYSTEEWENFGKVHVATFNNELAGVCVNVDVSKDFTELAVLLVLEKFRGKGISKILFSTGLDEITLENKICYTTTRNPIVKKLMTEYNFKFLPLQKLPLPILFFNIKFIMNLYRLQQYLKKKMYQNNLKPFEYGLLDLEN